MTESTKRKPKYCRHCGKEMLIEWTLVGLGYYYCFEGCPK